MKGAGLVAAATIRAMLLRSLLAQIGAKFLYNILSNTVVNPNLITHLPDLDLEVEM